MIQKIVIAIDGFSACGKSTTAKMVAAELGYSYIDTGAMYRAMTLFFLENFLSVSNPKDVNKAIENAIISFKHNVSTKMNETFLNGLNVESELRSMDINQKVSEVSAIPEIRRAMVTQQKRMGKKRGIVMDGRDIGTMVFPDAELKIFMTADIHTRAYRRQLELMQRNDLVDLTEVIENLSNRDKIDSEREEGPLRKADDAIELDTTYLAIDEQVDFVINLATARILKKSFNEEFSNA